MYSNIYHFLRFVALGTSLPDTFASRIAAQNEKTADNAIGNITGSNSVNIFLGLGLPWVFATIYWQLKVTFFLIYDLIYNDCCKINPCYLVFLGLAIHREGGLADILRAHLHHLLCGLFHRALLATLHEVLRPRRTGWSSRTQMGYNRTLRRSLVYLHITIIFASI